MVVKGKALASIKADLIHAFLSVGCHPLAPAPATISVLADVLTLVLDPAPDSNFCSRFPPALA